MLSFFIHILAESLSNATLPFKSQALLLGASFKEFGSARVSGGFSEGKLEQAEACRGQQEAVTGARGRDGGRPVQLRAGAVEARGLPARPYLVLTVDLGPRVNQNLKNP